MNLQEQEVPVDEKTAESTSMPEQPPSAENPMRKFDAPVLKAIGSSAMVDAGATAFLPQNLAQAMEIAKCMAAGRFVPPHLRGNPNDCLAVVFQATRWAMDPFAVSNKTYFVNDRMAFEAQLVNAVVNSSRLLDGRLQISWQGSGPTLQCTVRGRIKGDSDVHELIQEIGTITTRNSPLWKQAPKVQLAYHTTRSWGRLFTPEVLLGVYTPEEIEESEPMPAGTQQVIPPKPTRDSVKAEREAADRQRREIEDRDTHVGATAREETPHDAETGEVNDAQTQPSGQEDGKASGEQAAAETTQGQSYQALYDELLAKVKATGTPKALNALLDHRGQEFDELRTEAPDLSAVLTNEIAGRRKWFSR